MPLIVQLQDAQSLLEDPSKQHSMPWNRSDGNVCSTWASEWQISYCRTYNTPDEETPTNRSK
jgi:hypothetical protein